MRHFSGILQIGFIRLLLVFAVAGVVPACGSSKTTTAVPGTIASGISVPPSVSVAQTGTTIAVFAQGPVGSKGPDSIIQMGESVFVAYQDGLNPDGTIPPAVAVQGVNQIVQYDLQGNVLKTYPVPGHNDGLMAFNNHVLWAMSNEDSNPTLTTIDLTTGVIKSYLPSVAPTHGGGYDDMVMISGTVYVSCSNPANNPNTMQAIATLTLNVDGIHFDVAPVLLGTALATNIVAGGPPAALNLQDPDSEAIDPTGNLVLDDQGDSQLVIVHNPGPTQTVSVLPINLYGNPWPVDDTRFVPAAKSFMLVCDTPSNTIYRVDSTAFTPTAAFSAGQGTILGLNMTTGNLTPLIVGLNNPHGMVFVPDPTAQPPVTVVQSGYSVSVFATSPIGSTKPDSLVVLGTSLFVAYQDALNPDGTIPPAGTVQGVNQIVQYDFGGNLLNTYTVPGHNDGVMAFDSHTLWAMSNEDANPKLTTIDITTGTIKSYLPTVSPPAHGGGYDDMVQIGGVVYVSCSNPANNPNTKQAIATLSLNADGIHFDVAPVLLGTALATNLVAGGPAAALNLQDPDSEAVDSLGRLVLDDQGDSQLVFVSNPGPSQSVSVLPLTLFGNPWPVDDTRWAPSGNSCLLVADTPANVIYRIDLTGGFTPGTAYSAGQGTVLQLNTTTGVLTPVVVGMNNPHGMVFISH